MRCLQSHKLGLRGGPVARPLPLLPLPRPPSHYSTIPRVHHAEADLHI